jgi:hypothetical protein
MSKLFDRLQRELNSRQEEAQEGISVLDLVDLPEPLRKIMRLMFRKTKLKYTYSEVATEMESFNKQELDQMLVALVKQGWLIRFGEDESATYKVNLSRKRGSTLDNNFWSVIDRKIEERMQQQSELTEKNEKK